MLDGSELVLLNGDLIIGSERYSYPDIKIKDLLSNNVLVEQQCFLYYSTSISPIWKAHLGTLENELYK